MNATYTTANDVRDQLVLPALGDYATEHDVDAIVSAVILGWDDKGHAILVEDDDFWTIVERHAL